MTETQSVCQHCGEDAPTREIDRAVRCTNCGAAREVLDPERTTVSEPKQQETPSIVDELSKSLVRLAEVLLEVKQPVINVQLPPAEPNIVVEPADVFVVPPKSTKVVRDHTGAIVGMETS